MSSFNEAWSRRHRGFSTYWCCIFFFIFQHITRCSVTSETLELKQLSSQIDALIIQRQDDFNKLEAIARNSLNKDAEIDQLRNEIRDLKLELDSVKAKSSSTDCADGGANNGEGGGGCSNRMKNEHLTVEWLSNSISEIRAEIAEMAKWFNSTIAIQQRQTFSTDISILQNDVVSLRHDAEHLKADKAKYDAKLSAVGLDVDAVKQSTSNVAAKLVNLTQQIRVLSTYAYDFSSTLKSSKRKRLAVFKKMLVLNENPLKMQVFTTTRRRRRVNRHKNKLIERSRDYDDDHSTPRSSSFTPQDPLPSQSSPTTNKQDKVELEKRVRKLENLMNEGTYRGKGQEKLRSSMLELLESVESLEAKFDNVTPVLKKEISKMEFSLAQIIANLSIAREQQEKDRILVNTMAENLSDTRSKLARYERQFSASGQEKINDNVSGLPYFSWTHSIEDIMQRLLNSTDFSEDDYATPVIQPVSTLSQLFTSMFTQYDTFLRGLPKSCDEIEGESDLYLLSVDDSNPILVFCEKKSNDIGTDTDITAANSSRTYTVIQRRTNGQTDFNRNWQEYAHGFGNLRGEFWLGNDIIHRLTRNNDTGLRIELEDVSGRRWYAEYSTFSVAPRQRAFELHVDGFSGNATDAFQYHNRMQFSTKDADHDKSEMNCAADYESGWWFSHCQRTNLNAKFNLGLTWFDSGRNEWISISSTKMMLTKRQTHPNPQKSRQ